MFAITIILISMMGSMVLYSVASYLLNRFETNNKVNCEQEKGLKKK